MRFAELTDETWPLFERLFGPGGVQGGCWCAFFRLTGPEFKQAGKDGRKAHVRDEVAAGKPLGLLALADDEPVGWVAVSPRLDNPRLARSPVAASPGDHTGVWSVTCFYIGRKSRRQGVSAAKGFPPPCCGPRSTSRRGVGRASSRVTPSRYWARDRVRTCTTAR
ncbi:hypothetical protein [Amycolatopsis sp. WAC 04197]|uniref:hypothetical protein n=1 Tax=Amycolatopsis sp. WAC 04197 TaxID=2203199 RepID=UPI001F238D64|nr:hypothetical protein [Amycolatopsis sp. WAC 04197]